VDALQAQVTSLQAQVNDAQAQAAASTATQEQMAAGVVQIPAEFDNHATHIKCHNEFRKTLRYETMPKEERKLVDQHIMGHETMSAEAAGMMAQKMQVHPSLGMAPNANETPPQPLAPNPMTGEPGGFPPGTEPPPPGGAQPAQGGAQSPQGGEPLTAPGGVPINPMAGP
jgi:hypothetical protein